MPRPRSSGASSPTARSLRRRRGGARARGSRRPRALPLSALELQPARVLRRRRRLGPRRRALTAWANFQGPFTLHSVAAGALGLPGSKLRLITPPDSGGSFGIKSTVFAYVVLMGLASRKLGVPVRWIEDRLEHLAASSASSGRVTRLEAGFSADGELLALRYDAIEDVGAYVRAPEPATLYRMHGSLAGAYRVRNVAARNRVVLTNTLPERAQPRLRRPAALSRARADDDDRRERGSGSTLPTRAAQSRRRRASRTARRRARSTTPATTRAASTTRWRSRATRSAARSRGRARAEGRLVGVGHRLRRRAVDLEHGLHHARRTARSAACRSRETPRGARSRSRALGGITVRTATTPQGQGHRTVIAQVVADALGVEPEDVDVVTEVDTSTSPWTIASGNYSSRFSGVGVGAVAAAAERLAEKIGAIRAHLGDEAASLRRVAGTAHWNPESLPPGMEPGSPSPRTTPRRTSSRPMTTTGLPPRPRTASSSTSPSSRSIATPARSRYSTTSPSTTPDGCSIRCSPRARCVAASRTARRPRSSSATSTTRTATC